MAADAYLSDEAGDLTLFHYYGCFYCEQVRDAVADLGLVIAERNILEDPDAKSEIVEARGRRTVPVLRIDGDRDTQYLGESRDIIKYLYERFGDGKKPSLAARGALDVYARAAMWLLLVSGGLYAEGRLVLWSLAFGLAGARSLVVGYRSGATAHYLIGGTFVVAAIATVVEGLGWLSIEWWWLLVPVLALLALPIVRRKRA